MEMERWKIFGERIDGQLQHETKKKLKINQNRINLLVGHAKQTHRGRVAYHDCKSAALHHTTSVKPSLSFLIPSLYCFS